MKKVAFLPISIFLAILILPNCGGGGGGGGEIRVPVAQIISNQPADGDIAFDPVLQTSTIADGPERLFFGIDALDPNLPEYRAFLDFPLDGSTGQDVVPSDAVIVSATLEVFIDEVSFETVVPTLLDLVQYPITGLRPQDFDSRPLAIRPPFSLLASDEGNSLAIDVTSLMQEAKRHGLAHFQVRFLVDVVPGAFGFVGIEDRPNGAGAAALLIVEYQ